jgi:hypothetical protein
MQSAALPAVKEPDMNTRTGPAAAMQRAGGVAVHTMEGNVTNEYEELGLAMVNEVLEGMNWINVTE